MNDTADTFKALAWLAVVLAAGYGWIWNIVKLVNMDAGVTGWMVVRAIGIPLAPLGVVVGYL